MATQQRCRRSANISAIEGRPAVPFPPRRRSPARMQESHRSRTSPYGKSTSRRTRMRHENEWIRANAPDIEEPVNQPTASKISRERADQSCPLRVSSRMPAGSRRAIRCSRASSRRRRIHPGDRSHGRNLRAPKRHEENQPIPAFRRDRRLVNLALRPPGTHSPLTMFSVIFLASPSSIIVLSR
jgi:hypothetical protein